MKKATLAILFFVIVLAVVGSACAGSGKKTPIPGEPYIVHTEDMRQETREESYRSSEEYSTTGTGTAESRTALTKKPCLTCQPAGHVPNKTIWAAFFIKGVPVDLVDASPTGGKDAFGRPYPNKEIGSGASKIWTDGSGTAHVQMVRYGGNVSPANWATMQDVAEYLVTIVRQYDGVPNEQCPYYFFKP